MPICENCGTGIPVGHNFCYECGHAIGMTPAPAGPESEPPFDGSPMPAGPAEAPPAGGPTEAPPPTHPQEWPPSSAPPGWQSPPPPGGAAPPGWGPPPGWGAAPMWAPPFRPASAGAPKAENWGPRLLAALVDAVVAPVASTSSSRGPAPRTS